MRKGASSPVPAVNQLVFMPDGLRRYTSRASGRLSVEGIPI